MKVLYIHNDYGRLSGEEVAAEKLARLLTDHGHEVSWFRRSSAEIGTSLLCKGRAFLAGIHNPFAARTLGRTLDTLRPDLVQVQNIYPWFSPSIFRLIKARRIPIVMRCPNYRLFCPNGLHCVDGWVCERCLGFGREAWCIVKNCENSILKSTGYALRNAWGRITGSILRNVDMFVVQTAFQKQKFAERGISESRIAIVPGLLLHNGCAAPRELGNLVTFVGRVSPEKGIEDFLAAARLMPWVPFVVAGSDSGMRGIRDRSPANVQWLGSLEADNLRDLYRESRVIVVPSRWYEGFPNVIVQAMGFSRPVVATRIGAMTSIIDENVTGMLAEAGNPQDLAARINALYQDEELCRKMGIAGREKALAHYSSERVYSILSEVYERALRYSHQ